MASEQQERLVEALLTLARSEHGIDHGEPVDLRALAQEVLLTVRPRAAARNLTVDATLGPATVWGDPRLIERLITNLVDNAVRHNAPDGHVTVTTDHATLLVANTGPVIAESDIARLLQPFQRLARDRAAARDGHGLAIVHAIARTHDARLDARPRPDGGLDMEIAFPEGAGTGCHSQDQPVKESTL